MRSIEARLTLLEKVLTPDRMQVKFTLPDGTSTVGSVDEMIESGGRFCQVISGSDMTDLDRIIATIPGGAK